MIENGTFQARTHQGLEKLLEQDLTLAGAQYLFVADGAIRFKASEQSIYRFLMTSRVCTSLELILSQPVDIHQADVKTLSDTVNWTEIFPLDCVFSIRSEFQGSSNQALRTLSSEIEGAVQQIFEKTFGQSPKISGNLEEAEFLVVLRIEENGSCYFTLQAGGPLLEKRGMVNEKGLISPAMAAGIILMSGWDGTTVFVDPFANDGTLLLEAARIAKKRPILYEDENLLLRKWRSFRHALWKKVKEEAFSGIRKDVDWIQGYEHRPYMIPEIKKSAAENRLNENVSIGRKSADDIFFPQPAGLIMTALPLDAPAPVVDKFSNHIKKFAGGYNVGVFTNLQNLDSVMGIRPSQSFMLKQNGNEMRFFLFDIFKKKSESPEGRENAGQQRDGFKKRSFGDRGDKPGGGFKKHWPDDRKRSPGGGYKKREFGGKSDRPEGGYKKRWSDDKKEGPGEGFKKKDYGEKREPSAGGFKKHKPGDKKEWPGKSDGGKTGYKKPGTGKPSGRSFGKPGGAGKGSTKGKGRPPKKGSD